MIKLIDLLKESLLAEYNKSQLDYISSQLGIERNNEFDALMNALDSQGIKYPDLKNKIANGEIKSFNDLKALKTQSKSDIKQSIKSNSEIVYDNDDFFVVVPHTYKASCFYGANTKWCTTSKETDDSWNEYIKENGGTLYYILDKAKPPSDPLYKIAVLVDLDNNIIDIFNAEDEKVDVGYLNQIGIKDKVNFISKYDEIMSSSNEKIPYMTKLLNPQKFKLSPEELYIKGSLNLKGENNITLPNNLNVRKNLDISWNYNFSFLPNNLNVGGDLILTGTNIISLPNDLKVGGNIYLHSTPIKKRYTKEQIKQMVPGIKGKIEM